MQTPDEALVARLFREYLDAQEAGRDAEADVLARAGENQGALKALIRMDKQVHGVAERAVPGDARLSREAPATIGRFQVLDTIGKGGNGTVYRAFDPRLARRVALKVLHPEIVQQYGGSAFALNEARSLAKLEHPGVIKVHDVAEADGRAFFAMELLPGPSLGAVIHLLKRLDPGERGAEPPPRTRELAERLIPFTARIECLARIAEALAYCHDHGVLHRDVKPDNVLFDAGGQPKLIDFSLAHDEGADEESRLNLTQGLVGTPSYVAPEQIEKKRTGKDPRSDQFSFCTLAYEFISLENPFQGETWVERMDAIARCQPRRLRALAPAIPPDLALVIQHGHARLPEERYPDMAALAADLRAILEHRPISVSAPSIGHVARLWVERHHRSVVLASVLCSVLALAWIASWCISTWHARDRVRDDLRAIRPQEFERDEQFDDSLLPLMDLQRSARDFDEGRMRSWLWDPLAPEVERVVRAWSEGLGRCYEGDLENSRRASHPFQDVLYRRLFALEEILCPECDSNLAYRNRGRVDLPLEQLEGLESQLYQLMAVVEDRDLISVFRSTAPRRFLQPGTYRLQGWKPGEDELLFESNFLVEPGWPPLLSVQLRAPRSEFIGATTLVEASSYPLPHGPRLPVPAFRTLGRFVTLAEFSRFRQDTGFFEKPLNDAGADPEDPAGVSLYAAARMAAWAGGRLPSVAELQLAAGVGAIDIRSPGAGGEYVLDVKFGEGTMSHSYFRYSDVLNGERAIAKLMRPVIDPKLPQVLTLSPQPAFVYFRIAFSADRPERYRELAVTPLELAQDPGEPR